MTGGGQIGALVSKLERLGAIELKRRVAAKVASAIHKACLSGFEEQRDPYGAAWPPLKRRDHGRIMMGDFTHRILQKTGRGIEGLTATVREGAAVLRIAGYFLFHEHGTSEMVARMIYPEPQRGLGTWLEPVNNASLAAVRELMH